MIQGVKQEFECVLNRVTSLSRDIDYFLEANHPRKLSNNNFGADVVKHETIDHWGQTPLKEIILHRAGEYCAVAYFQGKRVSAEPCVYVAEPIYVRFIKEEA